MNTAKHDIFIGLKHDYCNLVEEINLWWWQRIKIKWWGKQRRVVFWEEFFQVGEWATPQLVLETFENLFLILTWKLVNRATTQIKKPSNWVTDNPTEYIFFNKIFWFMMSNAFCNLTSTSLLWPFVLYPTRGKWLWLKIE